MPQPTAEAKKMFRKGLTLAQVSKATGYTQSYLRNVRAEALSGRKSKRVRIEEFYHNHPDATYRTIASRVRCNLEYVRRVRRGMK